MSAPPTTPAVIPAALSFDDLLTVKQPPPEAVRALVEEVAAAGSESTVRLSHLLTAEAAEVRIEAARALALVGDARAITPLGQALVGASDDYSMTGVSVLFVGSALWLSSALFFSVSAFLLAVPPWFDPLVATLGLSIVCTLVSRVVRGERTKLRTLSSAAIAALAQIECRGGTSELRPTAAELRHVTRNVLLPPAVRSAARDLLQQLEEVDALPIPAEGRNPPSRDLPVPAAGPGGVQ